MQDLYLVKIPKDFKLDIDNPTVKEAIKNEVEDLKWWWKQYNHTYDSFKIKVTEGVEQGFKWLLNEGDASWASDDGDHEGHSAVIEILEKFNFIEAHREGIKDIVQIVNIN